MWQLLNLDSETFIRDYWQKKPCLLRNAFANFESPVSPEELAGLACEEDVHCRLVQEQGDSGPWQVRYGPFEEQDFLDLPQSHYSLLVSECEKWFPELGDLLDQFRFIPDWRVDDLMISYAPPQASVGAHVDEYDVFLLQAMGQRRWQYSEKPLQNPQTIPGLELSILQQFEADVEVTLEPGDMLYLPPGIAHHGVALDRCMTYSIGFRAPSASMLLDSFALELDRRGLSSKRYSDPALELDRHHGEITAREIATFKSMVLDLLEQPAELWRDSVGKLLSDSAATPPGDADQPVYISDLLACAWIRHPETRLLFHQQADGIQFYCNGQVYELPAQDQLRGCIEALCEQREWSQELIHRCIAIEELQSLLTDLAQRGAILPLED